MSLTPVVIVLRVLFLEQPQKKQVCLSLVSRTYSMLNFWVRPKPARVESLSGASLLPYNIRLWMGQTVQLNWQLCQWRRFLQHFHLFAMSDVQGVKGVVRGLDGGHNESFPEKTSTWCPCHENFFFFETNKLERLSPAIFSLPFWYLTSKARSLTRWWSTTSCSTRIDSCLTHR